MVKGLYTAFTGMVNEQHRLDVLSNNLANADTNGYKKEGATATTFADELAVRIKDTSYNGTAKKLGTMSMGVHIGETYTDYSQGNYKVTENSNDFAINGNGFFAVSFTDKAGNTSVKYTRDGAFAISADGYLRTKDGDYILNQNGAMNADANARIQLNPNLPITVTTDGSIYQDQVLVGEIGLVDFENYDYLSKYGENLYDMVDGGVRIESEAIIDQGYLEASNINIVSEMVNMIAITRAYQAGQKVINSIDQTLDKAVNQVGRVQ